MKEKSIWFRVLYVIITIIWFPIFLIFIGVCSAIFILLIAACFIATGETEKVTEAFMSALDWLMMVPDKIMNQ